MTDVVSSNAVAGPSDPQASYRRLSLPEPDSPPPSSGLRAPEAEVPTGEPPYLPPAGVIYPPERIPNPHSGNLAPQPVFEGIPPQSLYRPDFLPSDIDTRVDKSSVWMGVEKETGRAMYFLPPTCKCCTKPSVAQHCDRGWPRCARCTVRGIPCEPGEKWGVLKPKAKRRSNPAPEPREIPFASNGPAESSTSVFRLPGAVPSALPPVPPDGLSRAGLVNGVGKGKARAMDSSAEPRAGKAESALGDEDVEMGSPSVSPSKADAEAEDGGRGKRVRKKRRLSDADEIDPERLTADGSIKKVKKPSLPAPPAPPRPTLGSAVLPPTKADTAYFARIEANALKPPLRDMQGPCPVWAYTRHALCSAAEYLRDPVRTEGASVEIGSGGIARGIILEGEARKGGYWETDKLVGTILTSIGKSRARRGGTSKVAALDEDDSEDEAADGPSDSTPAIPKSPPRAELLPHQAAGKPNGVPADGPTPLPDPQKPREKEEPAIEALLLAHRGGTPLAIAVAQDYSASPFKVPRPFIVLGWFWVMDAWLESDSVSPGTSVHWKFRFEWCHFNEDQSQPWWPDKYHHRVYDASARDKLDLPTDLIMPDSLPSGSTSVLEDTWFKRHTTPLAKCARHHCAACNMWSEAVYMDRRVCLNEKCRLWWRDVETGQVTGPGKTVPSAWDYERLKPEVLGLKLRPVRLHPNADLPREQMGRQRWRSWICDRCGMANERKHWRMADCEACGNLSSGVGASRVYDEVSLRPPLRPVCTGPRQEDGLPSWPIDVAIPRSWTLYDDDVKIVQHNTSDFLANGSVIYHALNTTSKGGHIPASRILRSLQIAEQGSVPFKRHTMTTPRRQAERSLSPFYTYLAGPEGGSLLEAFPASAPVKWTHCPGVCVDAVDLINERIGRMTPGTREFNSLLIAAFPPELATSHLPKITVEPFSEYAILLLGPDATIKLRPAYSRTKAGELTLQHGDVVLVRSREDAIEVSIKLDTFGFACIARQCYQEYRGHIEDQMATSTRKPTPSANGTAAKVVQTATVAPPVAKLPVAPISEWYLGPTPIDPSQPVRELPSRRVELGIPSRTPSAAPNGEATVEAAINGDERSRITLSKSPPPPTAFAPAALSKAQYDRWLAGSNNDENVTASMSTKAKAKHPSKASAKLGTDSPAPASKAASIKDDDTVSVASKSSRGKRGGPRTSTGSARGRGRGRGRGRASKASEGDRSVPGSEAGEATADVLLVGADEPL